MEMSLLVTRQHTLKIYVLPTTHIMLRFAAVWHQSRSPTSFRVASGYYHPGAQFNIKMTSYQYRKSHCGDKTAVRSSYLHNGIFYTGKMSSLYWTRAQVPISESGQCNSSHYSDVIMSVMASQITSVSIVCTTVCSGADQRKHQSSASQAFVRGIHRWPVNSAYKGQVTRKVFPFDDVIMWRSVTHRSHLQVPNLPMSCRNLTTWQGTMVAQESESESESWVNNSHNPLQTVDITKEVKAK